MAYCLLVVCPTLPNPLLERSASWSLMSYLAEWEDQWVLYKRQVYVCWCDISRSTYCSRLNGLDILKLATDVSFGQRGELLSFFNHPIYMRIWLHSIPFGACWLGTFNEFSQVYVLYKYLCLCAKRISKLMQLNAIMQTYCFYLWPAEAFCLGILSYALALFFYLSV